MPTPFALVVLGLLVLLFVAGIVYSVRRSDRAPERTGSSHPEAPWSAEQAAEHQRNSGLGGPGGSIG